MSSEKLRVKDKFDTKSAKQIVDLGYPKNAEYIEDMLFWLCFPDPVCAVFSPFIASLPDAALIPHIANFMEFHFSKNQHDLVEEMFYMFIDERGDEFRAQVLSLCKTEEVRKLFDKVRE